MTPHPWTEIIEAERTWVDSRFAAGVKVAVDRDGYIAAVGSLPHAATRTLPGRALLPGMVNVHSHAFQRALRAQGEVFPAGVNDFWTWRESMYALVERLSRREFRAICRQAFAEMRAAGYTTVGEFHYFHHDDAALRDFAMDELVLEAAAEVGIRLVLLQSYYRTGGFSRELYSGQRRFGTPSVAEFWRHLDRLTPRLDSATQSIGLAPHSLRAVPLDDLRDLRAEGLRRGLVCHIHVEEQTREIEDALAAIGAAPLQWIVDQLPLDGSLTIIHGTHSAGAPLEKFIGAGGNVCLCPITEGNLGDGLADVPAMLARGDAVCIGSDSNIRIDPAEELRWLEFVQRLRARRRGVCKLPDGRCAEQLLRCGTVNGARALAIPTGEIAPGRYADFLTLDLSHPSLAGWTDEMLLGSYLFGSGAGVVRETCVGGAWADSSLGRTANDRNSALADSPRAP